MSLTLALVINVIAMLSLIAGLALVMSRAALLTPHRGADPGLSAADRSGGAEHVPAGAERLQIEPQPRP